MMKEILLLVLIGVGMCYGRSALIRDKGTSLINLSTLTELFLFSYYSSQC